MGRRPKLTPHQRQEAIKRRDRDEETLADIGRSYNVSPATISRLQLMDGFEFNPDVDENDAKALLAFAPVARKTRAPAHGPRRDRIASSGNTPVRWASNAATRRIRCVPWAQVCSSYVLVSGKTGQDCVGFS